MEAIYLDNAATSFPKPAGVSDRMKYYLDCVGANVNRSVYTAAQEAGLVTLTLRQRLAQLFDFPEPPTHVILTSGATAGLNMIISGLLRPEYDKAPLPNGWVRFASGNTSYPCRCRSVTVSGVCNVIQKIRLESWHSPPPTPLQTLPPRSIIPSTYPARRVGLPIKRQ